MDIAVLPWAPDPDQFDYRTFSAGDFADEDYILEYELGPGDEVFFIGCFTQHHGTARNIPVVRMGSIAAMTEEPVQTKRGPLEAYLVEATSIGGFSGSPVFARPSKHLVPGKNISIGDGDYRLVAQGPAKLIGVVHGHWRSGGLESDDAEPDGRTDGHVNANIIIVTPVSKLGEVLIHPDLVASRERQLLSFKSAPSEAKVGKSSPPEEVGPRA